MEMKINAKVTSIKFNRDDFYILQVFSKDTKQYHMVMGNSVELDIDDQIQIVGEEVVNPKFGKQIKATSIIKTLPQSKSAILNYLSQNIFNIGKKRAELIVDKFGEDTINILDNEPHRLKEVEGVGEKTISSLIECWVAQKEKRDALLSLSEIGLESKYLVKIIKHFGEDKAYDEVKKNPYKLIDILDNFGFVKVDKIASHLGFDASHPERIKAAIHYIIKINEHEGNSAIGLSKLFNELNELHINQSDIYPTLLKMHEDLDIILYPTCVYGYKTHHSEKYCSDVIKNLNKIPAKNISKVDKTSDGKILSNHQQTKIDELLLHNISILSGYPGCGKAQPLYSKIKTFDGWTTMGELKINDEILGPNNKLTKVVNIHPQGKKQIYEIELESGNKTQCCSEHLWYVKILNNDIYSETYNVLPLEEFAHTYNKVLIPIYTYNGTMEFKKIKKIKFIGLYDAQCIEVDSIDRLYITDDNIITHNTTCARYIVESLSKSNIRFALVAPTGRASKRLKESTGYNATTIHRFLDYDPITQSFKFGEHNKVDIDFLIVDECSMIDINIFCSLLKAIPNNCSIIFIGDPDQLLSVGPGKILSDMIDSNIIHVSKLTELQRIDENSGIAIISKKINQGENCNKSDFIYNDISLVNAISDEDILYNIKKIIRKEIENETDPYKDIQVLSPMKKSVAGVEELNNTLQDMLNGNTIDKIKHIKPGDKVMQIKNNYNKNVYNGDIGVVSHINHEDKYVIVKFDNNVVYEFGELDNLVLSYAATIHKSQGSEFPIVIIPLSKSHIYMSQRNLYYTAITRGKKKVYLVGDLSILNKAACTPKLENRVSFLKDRLQGNF